MTFEFDTYTDDIIGKALFNHDGRSLKGRWEVFIDNKWREAKTVIPEKDDKFWVTVKIYTTTCSWETSTSIPKKYVRKLQ